MGSLEFRRLFLERIPCISRPRISPDYVALQHRIVNRGGTSQLFAIAMHKI